MDFKIKVHEKWNKIFMGGGQIKIIKLAPPPSKI